MGVEYDDLPGHEGYAIRHERDDAWTAACSCGWRDDHRHHGNGNDGYDDAVDRWDTLHAKPLLERAVPMEVAELVTDLRRAVSTLAKQRPLAAAAVLEQLERWQAALNSRVVAVAPKSPTIQERLDALATRAARPGRGLGR